jgi:hypothetical protein
MRKTIVAATAITLALAAGNAHAVQSGVPSGTFGKLDHVFLIMMENESQSDILGNPNAPFINAYASIANNATNYFAVGHPSAPNYLELNGGSNFGLTGDVWPQWVGLGCVDNNPSSGCGGSIPPIAVSGTDNAVVATAMSSSDCNGQVTLSGPAVTNNCALRDYPATFFTPKTIADELVAKHKSWKTYQQSLPNIPPPGGGAASAFGVNYADGNFSNLSPAQVFTDAGSSGVQKLYAVKHNPFAYFQAVETGDNPALSMAQIVDFDGADGLWADLRAGQVPNYSFIVPDQCHDMHGAGGGSKLCTTTTDYIRQGDAEVQKLITGIKTSPSWQKGRNAIILVWDENDFNNNPNKVVMLVETNYAPNGRTDSNAYDHFSLLKTLEAGFGLPCLNHACDSTSVVMNTMFGG